MQPVEESDRLTEAEAAVVDAALVYAAATMAVEDRQKAYARGQERSDARGEPWECQAARRDHLRAKIAFRLALVKLRQQGQS